MTWADVHWSAALATGPAAEPLSYAEAKAFLRLPDDTDQTYVTALIVAARQKVEADTGRKLVNQSWDVYADRFPEDAIVLPFAPLSSVTSIKTTTVAGVQSTLAAATYQVDTGSARIMLADGQAWPGDLRLAQGIVIRCVFGYGAASTAIPSQLIRAVEEVVAVLYRTRAGMPFALAPKWLGYDAMIDGYRIRGIA